jgi:hypothetical protein
MLLGTLALMLVAGCASSKAYKQQFVGVETDLRCHDYKKVLDEIDANRDHCYKKKDRLLYYLDTGLLNHFNKSWEKSQKMLQDAERAIEESYTKSVTRGASSMVLNDNVLVYAGESYEDVYLNVFNALNYIHLGKFDDAMVEVKRIGIKLNMLEDRNAKFVQKYNRMNKSGLRAKHKPVRFYDSALARYISMIIYRANGSIDDARIDLERIKRLWKTSPNVYKFKMPNLSTALDPPPEGYARLSVISFIGRLPDKFARTMYITTRPRTITVTTSQQVSANRYRKQVVEVIPWRGRDPLPNGMTLKFEVPYIKRRPSNIGSIRLMIDGHELIWFSPLESMEEVAYETFQVKSSLIYMRAVLRTAIKSIACAQAIAELKKHNNGQNVPPELISAMFSATEHADLRVSQFFPALAGICEISVPVGTYHIQVVYYDHNRNKLYTDDLGKVNIRSRGLNMLESHYLD